MIILYNTTDKLESILDESSTAGQCVVNFKDLDSSTIAPGRKVTTSNNTTAVDITGSPTSGYQKIIDYISYYNSEASNNITVTIRYNDNGTTYIIFKTVLAAGEKAEYTDAKGWQVYSSNGSIKNSINQGANIASNTLTAVILSSDVTNNNAVANTIADVTGLSFAVTSGSMYYFLFVIYYTAAATTTGSRWAVNCTAGAATNLSFTSEYSLTTTTSTRNANVAAFDTPAACNATSAATGNNIARMEGFFIPTADGTFIARFASEVANSAIVAKAGSVCYYQKLT